MNNNIIKVGYFRVQNDWNYDIYKYNYMNYNDKTPQILPSKFWVTYCFNNNNNNNNNNNSDVNGKVLINKSDNNNYNSQVIMDEKSADDIFGFELLNDRSFNIYYEKYNIKTNFVAPKISWRCLHNTSLDDRTIAPNIFSMDISTEMVPNGNHYLGVSGSIDGSVRCWNSDTGTLSRLLNGHYGDVNVVRFFPSNQIILSGGSDTTLKLWLLDVNQRNSEKQYEGECIATLKGHTLGITSIQMIDRGRNFLSTSRDGKALIWDTSVQNFIESYTASSLAINDGMFLDSNIPSNKHPSTNDCHVFATTCEDRYIRAYDRRSDNKQVMFSTKLYAPLNCIAKLSSNMFIVGDDDGKSFAFDERKSSTPIFCVQNSSSSIQKLYGKNKNNESNNKNWQFWASDKRGETHLWQVNKNGQEAHIIQSLSGNDLESVNDLIIHQDTQDIFTANSDGYIRKYTNLFN